MQKDFFWIQIKEKKTIYPSELKKKNYIFITKCQCRKTLNLCLEADKYHNVVFQNAVQTSFSDKYWLKNVFLVHDNDHIASYSFFFSSQVG